MNYLCWSIDDGESIEHASRVHVAYGTCEEAAEQFAEMLMEGNDPFSSITVEVCEANDAFQPCGRPVRFEVSVDWSPCFSAVEVEAEAKP